MFQTQQVKAFELPAYQTYLSVTEVNVGTVVLVRRYTLALHFGMALHQSPEAQFSKAMATELTLVGAIWHLQHSRASTLSY